MSDPVSSGASSQLQSHLASQSQNGGKVGGIAFVMSFGNIGGLNFAGGAQGLSGALGLSVVFSGIGNALGLKNIMGGDKLSKKAMLSMFSKHAKAMGGSNASVFAGGPSISPPSIPTPQAPGGQGQTLG